MTTFLKKLINKKSLPLVIIFILAFAVRFYNFPERITFWSEQARSLTVSANYINDKFSLLGQEYFRTDSNGHKLFTGAMFNYSLIPLLIVSNYDPVPITAFFTLLNLLTGFVVYWAAKKIFNNKIATVAAFLFLFSDVMIYHSLFIWVLNYLPLVGILIIYFLWSFYKKQQKKSVFYLGLLCGLGISLQYLFAPFAGIVFLMVFFKSKNKLKDVFVFALGVVLGNLPMVLFDLRHNFYHLQTLWQYTLDTLKGASDAGFNYYYLLPLWPTFAIMGAYVLSRLNKFFATAVVVTYLYLNLISPKVSFSTPTGMPEGLTTKNIKEASQIISENASGDFNVVEVLDFDKRAYIFRYYLEFMYGKKPLSEIDYEHPDSLYVLSQKDYNFEQSDVWEINAGGPYKINLLSDIGRGYAIYKLQK